MLDVLVRNAHGNLSDKDKDYAAKKLGKLGRYFNSATKVEFVHTEEKHGHHVEVTVFADGVILRGDQTEEHLNAAIDLVADKLEKRMRRLKTRLVKRHRGKGDQVPMGLVELPESEVDEDVFSVDEERHYDAKPMGIEEAALMMEMMGKEFFVFNNVDTGQVEVVYNTKKGGVGLFTPES